MVYPRKKKNDHLLVGCPPGSVGVVTDSGWTDSKVFVQWLNHFVEAVKPTPAQKVVDDGPRRDSPNKQRPAAGNCS